MLPIPDTTVWSSSWRLISECLRRNTVTTPSRSKSGSSGSRAIWATGAGTSVPSTVTRSASSQPPNVRWSTKLSAVPSSSSVAILRCPSLGTGPSSICPLIPRCTTSAAPSSSVSHRYFPRLPVPVTVVSSSRAVRSAGPASCRRTARRWCTRTPVMVLPVTCASSPRRTTSTSGSSGIDVRGGQRRPRCGGGLQLCFLLGSADAPAVFGVHHDDRRGELLVVVGAGRGVHVEGRAHAACGSQLLQAALPVQPRTERRRRLDQRAKQPQDHLAHNRQAVFDIYCAEQGFDAVGQDARLVRATGVLLPLAQKQVRTEAPVGQRATHV